MQYGMKLANYCLENLFFWIGGLHFNLSSHDYSYVSVGQFGESYYTLHVWSMTIFSDCRNCQLKWHKAPLEHTYTLISLCGWNSKRHAAA